MKKIIIAWILSLSMTIFPSYTINAYQDDNNSFDLNSVDSQSSEIITELKESDEVIHYEESSESITFYIEEPILDESNSNINKNSQFNLYSTQSRAGKRGVTKIVWRKGFLNFNLYLSASTKSRISRMSNGAATAYLGHFLPGGIIVTVVVGALGAELPSPKNYSRGSVYVFRNASYRYSYYQ